MTTTTEDVTSMEANSLIKNYVIAATGLGLVPMPMADVLGLMALQVKLIHGLANHYGVPFKENLSRSLVTSLVSGATSVVGIMGLGSIAKMVPGLGTLGGGASVAITGSAMTYAVGQVFAKHFESGGTLLTFDTGKMRDAFKQKLKEGQEVAQNLKENIKEKVTPAAGPAPAKAATA